MKCYKVKQNMWNKIANVEENWPEHCLKNVLQIKYVRLNFTTCEKSLFIQNFKLKIKYAIRKVLSVEHLFD